MEKGMLVSMKVIDMRVALEKRDPFAVDQKMDGGLRKRLLEGAERRGPPKAIPHAGGINDKDVFIHGLKK